MRFTQLINPETLFLVLESLSISIHLICICTYNIRVCLLILVHVDAEPFRHWRKDIFLDLQGCRSITDTGIKRPPWLSKQVLSGRLLLQEAH